MLTFAVTPGKQTSVSLSLLLLHRSYHHIPRHHHCPVPRIGVSASCGLGFSIDNLFPSPVGTTPEYHHWR
jgi:hypothetical protein